jgi:mono/diheme cytochrome c family protein/glucose/arabinose dehydrogenase
MNVAARGPRVFAIAAGLLSAAVSTSALLVAQVGDRAAIDAAPPPADWVIPPAPVRSPEESMRLMELQPGFRIELVAAEPLVQDPIAFAFDERNRLWVLEWPSYNWPLRALLPGLEPLPTPPSRLVVLRDTDGDGRPDRRTVFAQMDWPRGIQLVNGGVLVFALPDVVFLRDTDDDDKADQRDVLAGGLPIPVNPHLAPSSPSWTLDNWTYGLQVDERMRLSGDRRLAGPAGRLAGQWGMSHDDYGRLFFSYNQDHIRGSLVPTAYATRHPHYTAKAGIDERIGQDNEVWPHAITPGVNRRAQLRDDGRLRVFTANAAPTVYRGDQFPEEYRGNVFVGESAGRLIRRSVLSERDGIITGRNAYTEREFLFSHDERFRPVFSATGPDGALYVADMYRGIIEGHIFLTTFLRNQVVDRGLQQPFHGMGRIYRIVHDGRPLGPPPPVSATDISSWVPVLAHPNGHWRDMAQRTLVAARASSVVPAVRALAMTHEDPRVRLHALWTLDGLGAADDEVVRARLDDRSPHLRIAALRIAESRLAQSALRRAVLARVDDQDVAVRRQVLYTLGASPAVEAENARIRLLRRDLDAPFVVDAFMSGVAGRELHMLERVMRTGAWLEDRPSNRALVAALASAVGREGRPDRLVALRRLTSDGAGRPEWQRMAIAEGLKASLPVPATASTAVPRDAATIALVEQGRTAYAICAACHQADGRGLPSLAPPLAGAANVTGPPQALIDIVLQGRDQDPAFPSMPPLAALPDDQLAAILTYVRQAWGNAAPAISADAVRARRTPAR